MRRPALLVLAVVTACSAPPGSRVPEPLSTTLPTSTAPTSSVVSPSISPVTPATTDRPALGPGEALAVRSDHPLEVFAKPDADLEPFQVLDATTELGTPRVVLVRHGPVDGWLRVALPTRPNGAEGWVRSEGLVLFSVDRRVVVDLERRLLRVTRGTETLLATEVAIGAPATPTPVGEFYVTDSVRMLDPTGPWGPHAFGLSAHSDTITEFNGGDGIIGIHGTDDPGSIGRAASLGCVRVPNEVAIELAGLISPGVPVRIRG